MAKASPDQIQTLELPLGKLSLVVPSASVAEIVAIGQPVPLPYAPDWVIGVVGWRTLGVPVVSFESLVAGKLVPVSATAHSKVVVFYPLPGRSEWEFFGILTTAEPRPRALSPAVVIPADVSDLPASPHVASGLKYDNRLLVVPDFKAVQAVFYPG